jgi:tetratricopeptide (TPR) repeat protein
MRILAIAIVLACRLAVAAEHQHAPPPPASAPPLFDDLGAHSHTVTTKSPEAQRYFDQGLRLVYAFNHDEAIRAFREAARIDPDCVMAQWGIALALGPNYNLPIDAEREKAAREAMARAQALAPTGSPKEQAYVAALAKRYAAGERAELDRAYAAAMREVMQKYPDDLDAATIFAESLMVLRPWALWNADGSPAPGTPEIVETLEMVLKKDPNHPGANHYYIHAVEASPDPSRALAAAERIPGLAPGAGHLVHMPSHIYMRVGRYGDAVTANERAIVADEKYLAQEKPGGVYPMMYYPHNIHFLSSAAAMDGRSKTALEAGRGVTSAITPAMLREMPMLEYFAPTAAFVMVRFGKWDEILAEPAPPAEFAYWRGMHHFARGMAFAATGRLDDAMKERTALADITVAMPDDRIVADNQPAKQLLVLAAGLLAGEVAMRQGNVEPAEKFFRQAVAREDALPYTEPPPWSLPVRHYLGALLLDQKKYQEALVVYEEDLQRNPNNGWSLYGLAESLETARPDEAKKAAERSTAAWKNADVKLASSRF